MWFQGGQGLLLGSSSRIMFGDKLDKEAPLRQHSNFFSPLRRRMRAGFARLRNEGWPVLQTGVAASAAWYLATLLLENPRPFFAPVAAIGSLGVMFGRRGPRAIQIVLGVAVGLTVANILVLAIGVGTVQIGIMVALGAALAIFLSGQPLLVLHTAITALVVVALGITTTTGDLSPDPDRFFEALTGSCVALVVNALLPVNPELRVERAVHPIFSELVATLEQIAAALAGRDLDRAERALQRASEINKRMAGFKEALAAGYETARFAPPRRRELRHLELYAATASQIDMAVADVVGVARAAVRAVRRNSPTLETSSEAILDLARAVEALATYLEKPGPTEDVRRLVLKAVGKATRLLEEHKDLGTSALVGEIRAMAMDLLRGTGMDRAEVLKALEEGAGSPNSENKR
jgi:FtsH-binding integral membrane protein